jgi:hypothetical protein
MIPFLRPSEYIYSGWITSTAPAPKHSSPEPGDAMHDEPQSRQNNPQDSDKERETAICKGMAASAMGRRHRHVYDLMSRGIWNPVTIL